MSTHRACCCDATPCWYILVACCTEHDDAYITCGNALLAGIVPGGAGQTVFKYRGQCYSAGLFEGEPPEGATILGAELVGAIEFFDDCGDGPGGCCEQPGCWHVARRCCEPSLSCEPGFEPPELLYIDCDALAAQQFMGNLPPLPFTFHPPWFDQFPDCVPCYRIEIGDTVETLPVGAVTVDPPTGTVVDDCLVAECCPPIGPPCEQPCATPTKVVWNAVPVVAFSTCACVPPANPQAWPASGNHDGPFGCDGDSPVDEHGCSLWHWETDFDCAPVFDFDGVLIGIYYTASLVFKQSSGYDINADCTPPDGCAYQFPGQTCNDPCPANEGESLVVLRTPTLPPTTCPNPSDFTIVVSQSNFTTTPTIVGFLY